MKVEDFYKEDEKELAKLCSFKMKLTKAQEKLITDNYCLPKETRYVSFIHKWNGKIIEQVFACRKYKSKPEYQEVQRRIEGNKLVAVRNMYCLKMADNRTVWSNTKLNYWYFPDFDRDKWLKYSYKYFRLSHTHLYNLEDLIALDESLKYCAYDEKEWNVIDYITIYRRFPEIEMLSKLGLSRYISNYKVLEALKEKAFKKFLFTADKNLNSRELLYCYKHKMSPKSYFEEKQARIETNSIMKTLKPILIAERDIPKDKLFKYLKNNPSIRASLYVDMIRAEKYLHLDLTLDKNLFPHDFMYWHDYYTKQMSDGVNAKTDSKIKEMACKYKKLVTKELSGYKLVLPKCTNDLIVEGERLKHCVGRMGYNKKIAEEKSLIIFVRKEKEVDTPFVTMEYDPNKKAVLQLYGEHDTLPEQALKDIIFNKWLPKVRRLKFV